MMYVVRAFGEVIGTFHNGDERTKKRRIERILAKEFRKRHDVTIIKLGKVV